MARGDKEKITTLLGENSALRISCAVLEKEVDYLKQIVGDQKTEIKDLKISLQKSYEALVAKESPDAYMDMQISKEKEIIASMTPEERAKLERNKKVVQVQRDIINRMEDPLFLSPEDMQEKVESIRVTHALESKSLHGDDES